MNTNSRNEKTTRTPNKATQHYHERAAGDTSTRRRSRPAATTPLTLTPEHRRLLAAIARVSGGAPDSYLAEKSDLSRAEVARLGYDMQRAGLVNMQVGLFATTAAGRQIVEAFAAHDAGVRS